MFVRTRIPLGEPHPALLVTDRAVGTDQGLKFLYVVDAQNKVQYRRVTLGPLQDDGLRVVADGLEATDWVVVSGLQQVRPRMEVKPERVPMPVPAAEVAAEQSGPGGTSADKKAELGTDASATPAADKPEASAAADASKPATNQNTPAVELKTPRAPANLRRPPWPRNRSQPHRARTQPQ